MPADLETEARLHANELVNTLVRLGSGSSEHQRSILEAALLQRSSERFYKSLPFRVTAAMLAFATGFALFGTWRFNADTANLRAQLKETAARVEAAIEHEKARLDERFVRIEAEQEKLLDTIQQGKDQVKRAADRFRTEMMNLKDETVRKALATWSKDWQAQVQDLEDDLRKARTDLTARVQEIRDRDLGGARSKIRILKVAAAKLSDKIEITDSLIVELNPLAERVREREKDFEHALESLHASDSKGKDLLAAMKASAEETDELARQAQGYASNAKGAAEEVTKERKRLERRMRLLASRVEGLDERRIQVEVDLAVTARKVAELEGQAKAPAKAEETPTVATVPETQPLAGGGMPEDELTQESWGRIQRALAQRGFAPGPVDGKKGGRTVKAIMDWQKNLPAEATGCLTADQIELLLSLGPR